MRAALQEAVWDWDRVRGFAPAYILYFFFLSAVVPGIGRGFFRIRGLREKSSRTARVKLRQKGHITVRFLRAEETRFVKSSEHSPHRIWSAKGFF